MLISTRQTTEIRSLLEQKLIRQVTSTRVGTKQENQGKVLLSKSKRLAIQDNQSKTLLSKKKACGSR